MRRKRARFGVRAPAADAPPPPPPADDIDAVKRSVRQQRYQDACLRVFCATHDGASEEEARAAGVARHPNAYFEASISGLGAPAAAAPAGKAEGGEEEGEDEDV